MGRQIFLCTALANRSASQFRAQCCEDGKLSPSLDLDLPSLWSPTSRGDGGWAASDGIRMMRRALGRLRHSGGRGALLANSTRSC